MPPPDRVLAGSARWLDILRRNTLKQGWVLIGADPRYGDMTRTQYHAALEWLLSSGLLIDTRQGIELGATVRNLPPSDASVTVLATALELSPPPWLADSDELIPDPSDLPQDAESMAEALQLDGPAALQAVRRAQRKVDLEARSQIGAAGETAVLGLLERFSTGSTTHVAADDDTAGYDVAFVHRGITWHLEIKATNRRGRLIIYLSRHEYETSLCDPNWRLVIVGLDEQKAAVVVATACHGILRVRSPLDIHESTGWASARYSLGRDDLDAGLRLDTRVELALPAAPVPFAWAPEVRTGR